MGKVSRKNDAPTKAAVAGSVQKKARRKNSPPGSKSAGHVAKWSGPEGKLPVQAQRFANIFKAHVDRHLAASFASDLPEGAKVTCRKSALSDARQYICKEGTTFMTRSSVLPSHAGRTTYMLQDIVLAEELLTV